MALKRINSGRGHRYTLDGRKCDGVTTLIGKGVPKPAMPYWSARTVAEYVADVDAGTLDALRTLGRDGMVKALKQIPWSQRDAAAVRGTAVHAIADKLVRGEQVDVPDHLAGHVEQCVKFLDTWRPSPVLIEASVAHRGQRYAGTLDLVADLPDGRRPLFDYKTSMSGIWPETALQLAAYRYAQFYVDSDGKERPMSDVGITCSYAVWLRADGYDVIPVDTGPAVYRTFTYVAAVARAVDEDFPKYVGDAEEWREP